MPNVPKDLRGEVLYFLLDAIQAAANARKLSLYVDEIQDIEKCKSTMLLGEKTPMGESTRDSAAELLQRVLKTHNKDWPKEIKNAINNFNKKTITVNEPDNRRVEFLINANKLLIETIHRPTINRSEKKEEIDDKEMKDLMKETRDNLKADEIKRQKEYEGLVKSIPALNKKIQSMRKKGKYGAGDVEKQLTFTLQEINRIKAALDRDKNDLMGELAPSKIQDNPENVIRESQQESAPYEQKAGRGLAAGPGINTQEVLQIRADLEAAPSPSPPGQQNPYGCLPEGPKLNRRPPAGEYGDVGLPSGDRPSSSQSPYGSLPQGQMPNQTPPPGEYGNVSIPSGDRPSSPSWVVGPGIYESVPIEDNERLYDIVPSERGNPSPAGSTDAAGRNYGNLPAGVGNGNYDDFSPPEVGTTQTTVYGNVPAEAREPSPPTVPSTLSEEKLAELNAGSETFIEKDFASSNDDKATRRIELAEQFKRHTGDHQEAGKKGRQPERDKQATLRDKEGLKDMEIDPNENNETHAPRVKK